jgi:hypothetical protein
MQNVVCRSIMSHKRKAPNEPTRKESEHSYDIVYRDKELQALSQRSVRRDPSSREEQKDALLVIMTKHGWPRELILLLWQYCPSPFFVWQTLVVKKHRNTSDAEADLFLSPIHGVVPAPTWQTVGGITSVCQNGFLYGPVSRTEFGRWKPHSLQTPETLFSKCRIQEAVVSFDSTTALRYDTYGPVTQATLINLISESERALFSPESSFFDDCAISGAVFVCGSKSIVVVLRKGTRFETWVCWIDYSSQNPVCRVVATDRGTHIQPLLASASGAILVMSRKQGSHPRLLLLSREAMHFSCVLDVQSPDVHADYSGAWCTPTEFVFTARTNSWFTVYRVSGSHLFTVPDLPDGRTSADASLQD